MNIKEMVQKGKVVKFSHYFDGSLWYSTECGFTFPVPIDDTGNATFKHEDQALYFMRWIRKHIQEIENHDTESTS